MALPWPPDYSVRCFVRRCRNSRGRGRWARRCDVISADGIRVVRTLDTEPCGCGWEDEGQAAVGQASGRDIDVMWRIIGHGIGRQRLAAHFSLQVEQQILFGLRESLIRWSALQIIADVSQTRLVSIPVGRFNIGHVARQLLLLSTLFQVAQVSHRQFQNVGLLQTRLGRVSLTVGPLHVKLTGNALFTQWNFPLVTNFYPPKTFFVVVEKAHSLYWV